jgi:S-adenosylmethionine hydrolase
VRLALALCGLLCSTTLAVARPIVVFLSDFGTGNEAVALCHGAMLSVCSEIEVVDLTHAVPSFNVGAAARVLERAVTFPAGAVFVSVVDPGVGTKRRAIALRTRDGSCFVAPDNGLLSLVVRRRGVAQAVELDPIRVNPHWHPGTFDGRDLFAPAAARLAVRPDLQALGAPIDSASIFQLTLSAVGAVLGPGEVSGTYVQTDEPYGNVWTDIARSALDQAGLSIGDRLEVTIGGVQLLAPFVTTFGDVGAGRPLAYLNSEDRLAFAVNLGSLRDSLQVSVGAPVIVLRAASSPEDPSRVPTPSAGPR